MAAVHDDDDRTRSYVALEPGSNVSHYRIERRIGSGGMGEVYLAKDTALKRGVALKFIPYHLMSVEGARARFKREAQSAAALNHPNIITIHEVSEHQGRPFFAMEHIEGPSLRDLIKGKELSLSKVLDFAIQISEGLREAHEKGVVHRDIKPSNIVLDKKGRCVILDFGLAVALGDEKLTKTGSTLGTVGYMSPEQAEGGHADHRSDIFSFGVLIYEMLTCQQPFYRETEAATLQAIVNSKPEPMARFKIDVPEDLQRIVDKALEKDPEMRYQHVDDILTDLKRVRRGIESGELDAGVIGTSTPAASMLRYVKFAGLALIAALIVLLLYPPGRQAIRRLIGLDRVPTEKHLVVLPFTNLGDATANQAFCDGLMETLSSKLTQLEKFYGSLWVVPASQVRREDITSPREARRAFGVALVVTGSVQRFGDNVRMTLNLVDAKTERQLRSKVIDDSLSNVSALQDSMVIKLVSMLEMHLQPEERRYLAEGGTTAPKAYDFYIQARGYLQHMERESNIDSAITLFQRAINVDPLYASAYAGLGEAHWRKYEMFGRPESKELAIYYSRYAVELNDELAPAHITLALIYRKTFRYQEAVHELQQALRLDSASHLAYHSLALAYEALNELELAESAYRKAIDLKPDYWLGNLDLGFFYASQGRQGDALEWLDKIVELGPEGYLAWNNLGALYYYLDRLADARAMWERSLEIDTNYAAYSNLGTLHYLEGRFSVAAQMYERALDMSDHDYLVWGNLASAYYWTPGDRERAPATYQHAIQKAEERLKVNPGDPEVLSALAEYRAAVGDHREAVSLIDQVITLAPDNADVLVSAGLVYEELGDRETALKWIGKALQQGYPKSEIEDLPEFQDLVSDPAFESIGRKSPDSASDDSISAE